jgi:hypothetical protein
MTDSKLSPAAQVLDGQDRPDQGDGIRSLQEALEYWRSSDLPEVFREADRELLMARLGQGRWEKMKQDLMCGRASCVRPIEYCVEISPEDAAYLEIDLDDLLCEPTLGRVTKMLDLRGLELMWRHGLEDVKRVLVRFEGRIPSLARTREALRRAMLAEAWAYSAAQQGDVYRRDVGTAPVSRGKR